MRLVTSSPGYPQSNGMAERAVKIVKGFWRKANDRDSSIFAYWTTLLKLGYSPSELMFGKPIRSTLGVPYFADIDYNDFEDKEMANCDLVKSKWDTKYRARPLPKLEPGDKVWIKSPTDKGCNGTVLREDPSPDSFWVKMGSSEVCRNRKHLFLLHDTETENIFYDCQDDFSPLQEETELKNDEQPAEDRLNTQQDSLVHEDPGSDSSGKRNCVPVVTRSGRTVRAPQNPYMMYY